MKQIARIEYLMRHAATVAPYLSWRKLSNLVLNAIELRLNITEPRSAPPYLKIEPTPNCHMACPGCAHGVDDLKKKLQDGRHQLSLEDVERSIDPIADKVLGVSVSLRGEPLLGRDVLPIIEYCHRKKLAVSFPTNLSVRMTQEKIVRLVKSGVDVIYVSLDGASEETYGKYRIGGDFNLVLRNTRAIAETKDRLHRSRPRLVWKFVVFDHNRHEVPRVVADYRRLGFDAYEFVEDHDSEHCRKAVSEHNARLVRERKACYWAWHTAVIRADGVVAPCCLGSYDNFGLGNVRTERLVDIWRNAAYASVRRGFRTMSVADLHPVCARCLEVQGSFDEPHFSG